MREIGVAVLVFLLSGAAYAKNGVLQVVQVGPFTVKLDIENQKLKLEMPPLRDVDDGERAPVFATVKAANKGTREKFVSASVLAVKARIFDDGLLAAVELAAERGEGKQGGKRQLLEALAKALSSSKGTAVEVVLAAAALAGISTTLTDVLKEKVAARKRDFLGNELRSKPIGFYGWTPDLSAIFRQGKMLQEKLGESSGIEAVVKALAADKTAADSYRNYLALMEGLTNPFAHKDLRAALTGFASGHATIPEDDYRFLPPSRAFETDLGKKLYGDKPIPKGFSLVNEMIKRIRRGSLSLKPSNTSGWYDHQTYALEPLIIPEKMPEGRNLKIKDTYRKHLKELFKAILTLTRETHVRSLELVGMGGGADVIVSPNLSVEPVATYYLRRGESYQFVRGVLENAFGKDALRRMFRLSEAGPVEKNLDEELRQMEELFMSAAATVGREIGVKSYASMDASPFREWASNVNTDPDVGQDVRAMVPVFYDVVRKKTKAWVFLGWGARQLDVEYAVEPKILEVLKGGKPISRKRVEVQFWPASYTVVYPVSREVYVNRVLSRKEFRKLCNKNKTEKAILKALGALKGRRRAQL